MLQSFEPIVDEKCKILILGTMPGEESLRKQQYYAYSRNQFWKIIFELLSEEFTEDYIQKKEILLKHHIALWDVLKNCDRETSSDTKIKNPIPNAFRQLLQHYPNIKHICFNGAKAEELFIRLVLTDIKADEINFYSMPSTSPANTQKYEDKLSKWVKITELIYKK